MKLQHILLTLFLGCIAMKVCTYTQEDPFNLYLPETSEWLIGSLICAAKIAVKHQLV